MEKLGARRRAPPPSRYPRLQDGTLVRATDVAFPASAGVTSPRTAFAGVRGANRLPAAAGGGAAQPLPLFVPQVDRDGNQPRRPPAARTWRCRSATYTGWNLSGTTKIGGTEQFFPLIGGYVPFASTKAEREQNGDPRPSIEERYQSREQYLGLVQEAAAPLVKEGYLLAEDVPAIVTRAGEHWDLLTRRATTTSASAR